MTKQPSNKQQYEDLVRKIEKRFKDIGKRGFEPLDNIYGKETPKRVLQKHLNKLENIVKNIYKFARYYDPIKDKFISGEERRKQERASAARKGWEKRRQREEKTEDIPRETDLVLRQIEELINSWSPSSQWSAELQAIKAEDRNTLKSVLEGAIARLGRETVAMNCLNSEIEVIDIVNRVLYESGDNFRRYGINSGREGVQRDIIRFRAIIEGRPLTVREAMETTEWMEESNEGE